jgi:ubiquitin carboxyl-terminal hydrolase 4/11/15
VRAYKTLEIYRIPPILMITLKRFKGGRFGGSKLGTFVEFPLNDLDLSDYVLQKDKKLIYDCFAVSNHMGGAGGGHYTAYARNATTDKWYKFDDSQVSPIDPESVITSAAYSLFYRLRGHCDLN